MKTTETDCRTDEGLTTGIIDSIITLLMLLDGRDLSANSTQEALKDLMSNNTFNNVLVLLEKMREDEDSKTETK